MCNMENQKEIHFFRDESFMSYELDVRKVLITYEETEQEIKYGILKIATTSIANLDFEYLYNKCGYSIFLHENDEILEIYPGIVSPYIDKEIRIGHNIQKLWIGGAFRLHFYKNNY